MTPANQGTSCEASKLHPCPERTRTMYRVGKGYRAWLCSQCVALIRGKGVTCQRVRTW